MEKYLKYKLSYHAYERMIERLKDMTFEQAEKFANLELAQSMCTYLDSDSNCCKHYLDGVCYIVSPDQTIVTVMYN